MDWPSAQWQALVPESLLSRAPLSENTPIIEHVGLVATGDRLLDTHTFDQLRDCLLILGVHEVTQARGYANDGLATTIPWLSVATIALVMPFATAGLAWNHRSCADAVLRRFTVER